MKDANSAPSKVIVDTAIAPRGINFAEVLAKASNKKDLDSGFINAFDLYSKGITEIPTLLNPFLQKVGLASLVGTSDAGKSTFLRQLSISIALGMDSFMGFQLNCDTNKVIYVSTEDDQNAVGCSIKKQLDYIKKEYKNININFESNLKGNLEFLFETDNLLAKLSNKLKKQAVDLIVIDAFSDVFTKELNANTQVRQFLNGYDKLAKANNCLILFLHHNGKRTQHYSPTKDSIIGSQGFEAKMRVVLELRPAKSNPDRKELWVVKGNFLDKKHKSKGHVFEMNDNLIFNATKESSAKLQNFKSKDPEIIKKTLELNKGGKSLDKIVEEFQKIGISIGRSTISNIIKEHKAK